MYSFKWITTSRITCAHAARARPSVSGREGESAAAVCVCAAYKCGRLCHVNQFVFFALFRSFLSFHFISFMRHRQFIIFHWMENHEWKGWDGEKKNCVSWNTITIITTAAIVGSGSQVNFATLKNTKSFTKCKEISSSSQHMYGALFSKLI